MTEEREASMPVHVLNAYTGKDFWVLVRDQTDVAKMRANDLEIIPGVHEFDENRTVWVLP